MLKFVVVAALLLIKSLKTLKIKGLYTYKYEWKLYISIFMNVHSY